MRYKHGRTGIARLAASTAAAVIIGCHILLVPYAYATGTTINASVCGQTAGTLQITSPAAGSTVGKPDVIISGRVSNLSQIRAYINGVFHMTVPLDTSSTSFTYTTNLARGQNTVKLIGVDPCNANGPEDVVSLTFDPGAPVSPLSQALEQTADTAVKASDYMNGQVAQAAHTAPAAGLSGTAFSVMQALDLAPIAGSTQSMERMTQRFTAVVSGVTLMLFAQPMFAAYHLLRYQFLQWNIHAFPVLVRRHAMFILRALGAVLLVAGLFL